MWDKSRLIGKRKAAVISAILIGAMTLSQAAPLVFAEEKEETTLAVTAATEETEEATEQAEETEKKVYEQLETTNTSEAVITAIDVSGIVEAVMPSIVMVTEKSVEEVEDFFGNPYEYEVEGAASGFIIAQNNDELLIATNNHVVENSTEVTVAFSVNAENEDDLLASARVKGTDPKTDLAVIAVKLDDINEKVLDQLKIAVLGSSDDLKVGQTAITIGNAMGEGISVTSGIISALNVDITTEDGSTFTEFQTDGAANQGQSGGAIINARGEVIGVFNAGLLSGDNMGYGVPISTAIPVLKELINRETRDVVEEHGYMGITVVAVSDEASQFYNIPEGAYVYEVNEGSAADKAGIQKGDIVTGFDGLTISSQEMLLKQVTYYAPGETVEVTVQRPDGTSYVEKTFEVTLEEAPKGAEDQNKDEDQKDSGKDSSDEQENPSAEPEYDSGFGFGNPFGGPFGDLFGGEGGYGQGDF